MKCEFVVGQRVVCIKVGEWTRIVSAGGASEEPPKNGEVCTISRIFCFCEYIMLELEGFAYGYDAKRFRPLAEPDISVFNAILAEINAGKVKPVGVPA